MNHIIRIFAFATACLISTPAIAASNNLFNTMEYRTDSLDALPQWQRTLAKIEREEQGYRDCAINERRCSSRALQAWQSTIKRLQGSRQIDQLIGVNNFVNQWRYRADGQNYGRSDYWASPNEFFRRSGDCEDYAIAKYVTLRQLGFGAEQLRLVVVNDKHRNLAHAVLAAYVNNEIYILDNLSNEVRPQSAVSEYTPYYSVNENARWAHAALPASSKGRSMAKADAAAGSRLTAKMLFSQILGFLDHKQSKNKPSLLISVVACLD